MQPVRVDIVRNRSKVRIAEYQNDALMESPGEGEAKSKTYAKTGRES